MKGYEVFFEIGGKKMKTTVFAENQSHAKQLVQDKIIFHKIVQDTFDEDVKEIKKMWKDIFGTDL